MSDECQKSCASCSDKGCAERKEIQKEKLHELSRVGKVIGVVSGKGGVGKSLVTSLLAMTMTRRGYHTAILDADITGPSIPRIFGLREIAETNDLGIIPARSKAGVDVISINLLLKDNTDPVVWRGPVIAGVVKKFWHDVIWKDVDYLFVDMPPGTGDVPLTVFQSLPVDGIIIVTSPQELVAMIVAKAVKMARKMKIPIIGLVENMAYFKCPDCDKEHKIFGDSHVAEISNQYNIPILGRIPIDPEISATCDQGLIGEYQGNWLDEAATAIEQNKVF